MPREQRHNLVDLAAAAGNWRWAALRRRGARWLERLLALDQLNRLHAEASAHASTPLPFILRCLQVLDLSWHTREGDVERIPQSGPLIIVANHPFGAIEGMILPAILLSVRHDVKIFANYLLARIPELRDLFFFIDPFDPCRPKSLNISPLRQAVRHVKSGGALVVFPAGEVASFNLRSRGVADPIWSTTIARLVRMTHATVLPVFFAGRNSNLFHALGLLHPRLRTALLCREVFNKRHQRVSLRIGSPIPINRLEQFESDEELTGYLRQRTFMLSHTDRTPPPGRGSTERYEPIIAPVDPTLVRSDIESLRPDTLLVRSADLAVYSARAPQIPNAMRELGRLREITFRATGEGTGKSCDIDSYDDDYLQLIVWNSSRGEIAGAYRLGPTDEILPTKGEQGLYTTTLFDCDIRLLRQITPALELGRSFVRAEYQKSYQPLLLLWKGIGQYVVRHPRYRHLFGPVSISNTYQSVSKQLMVQFLRIHHCAGEQVRLVQPRNPFRPPRIGGWDWSAWQLLLRRADDVSELVSDLEPDHKGIPVLLRQYLKLGAKLLAFNVDPRFSDCVDGLLVADLARTDTRLLDRYMGRTGREMFLRYHRERAATVA